MMDGCLCDHLPPMHYYYLTRLPENVSTYPDVSGSVSAFSAAPTSTSCLVISLFQQTLSIYSTATTTYLEINTWRPGATVWTTHRFENQLLTIGQWTRCVFSNGIFYTLSSYGYLGVFDPSRETSWNVLLQVKPWPDFRYLDDFRKPVLIMEHEGDIFVLYIRCNNNYPSVFKLNLKRKVWEEKKDLGGFTVFARHSGSLTRVGLSTEERNRIYHYDFQVNRMYYYSQAQGDDDHDKSSHPPSTPHLSRLFAWVDPPHNNFHF